ncbi:MAG: DUF4962 domain-containing protein [Candidatus Latescibacteria bacterium]|nr:DUF4962 domain-containing protein [Candidatus Latescibacterota bacterium]
MEKYIVPFILMIMIDSICYADESIVINFESGQDLFHPQTKTVTVSKIEKTVIDDRESTGMQIRGSVDGEVYYAVSNRYPIREFQHYRLAVWMRINADHSTASIPSLKCEFMSEKAESSLGFGDFESYDTICSGSWQHLSGEFRTPLGTRFCRFVLDTGCETLMEAKSTKSIDITIDDIKIEPIDHYTIDGKYRLKPVPASLEIMRGVHPRLYLTKDKIIELRSAVNTTHASLWKEFIQYTDKLVEQGPPKYQSYDDGRYDEQWWQVPVGNNIPILALAYVISGKQRYLESAREWALASCGYKTWGTGWVDGMDCITGHHLFGLSLLYDWCYDSLDKETLGIIRETLVKRTAAMFEASAKGTLVPGIDEYKIRPWPEWDEAYLQNHLWVNTSGMAIAGLALFDEVDDASQWIGFPLDRYRRTMHYLGPDGASHEGINYWSYGMEHLLKFMTLARDLLDEDMFGSEWFRNTANYRLYMSLPQNAWVKRNITVNYGDSYRRDSYGPDHQLRFLAGEYRNGYAQWLAQELDNADVLIPTSQWFNLVWYDPAVEAKSPTDLPTMHYFTDMDFISARSDWSGDESFIFYKCGPYIGHYALYEMPYCPSSAHHVHPDANHFVLFGNGEWLLRDNENQGKYTGQHNTLLINDGEQYGGGGARYLDGGMQAGGGGAIFDAVELHAMKKRPHIIRAVSTERFDHMAGDATEAYPESAGLKRYIRHLVFVKPDVLIVVDDIELDRESDLELRFIPEQQEARQDGSALFLAGQNALLRFDNLTSEGTILNAEKFEAVSRRNEKEDILSIRVRTQKNRWRNAVALSWCGVNEKPVKILLDQAENIWNFRIDNQSVIFDWTTGNVVMNP